MKKIVISIFISFIFIFELYAVNQKIYDTSLIYRKDKAVIYKLNTGSMNKMAFLELGYYLKKQKKDNIDKIYQYYVNQLKKLGYRKNSYNKNKTKFLECFFLGNKNLFSLMINNNKKGIFDISITIQDKGIMDIKKIDIKNKCDNPGFDFNDIPRYPGSIRFFSVLRNDINDHKYREVMYKFYNNLNSAFNFYKTALPNKGWLISDLSDFKNFKSISCKKSDREINILMHYNPEIKKNIILITEY